MDGGGDAERRRDTVTPDDPVLGSFPLPVVAVVDEDVVVLPGRVPQPEGSESGFEVSGQSNRLDNLWSLEVQPLLAVQVVPADPDVVRNDPLQIFVC